MTLIITEELSARCEEHPAGPGIQNRTVKSESGHRASESERQGHTFQALERFAAVFSILADELQAARGGLLWLILNGFVTLFPARS